MNVRDFLRRTSAELAIVLFFVFWAVVITRPLAFHLTTHTIQGPDPPSHLYMLDRLSAQLTDPVHLFEGNIYFPARHTLLFTDLSMGTVVLVWPLRLIVHDATTLFNLGTILAFAFGGYAFHALTRSLTGSRAAGLLAGGLAAFNSHQATHVPHLNLITTGWMALALLGFHRLLTRPSPWSIVLTGVSCALTIQSSGYYAVALAVCAIVFVIYHWRAIWISRSNPQRGWVLFAFGAAFLVTVLLCSLYLRAFLELRAEEWLRRPSGVSAQMSFKPGRDLTSVSYLWGSWLGRGGERLFPGAVCLLLSVMAIWRRRPQVGFYCVATVVLLLLSLGPQIQIGDVAFTLPYHVLFGLPPLNAMRHPFTFAAVAGFLLAVTAGIGWAGLACSRRRGVGVLIVSLAFLETLAPPVELRPVPTGLPPAYQLLQKLPPGAILDLPVFNPESMLWATRHDLPVVNGIGAFAPRYTLQLEQRINRHWIASAPDDLDRSKPMEFFISLFPLRYVIVPCGRAHGYGGLVAAFERSKQFVFVARADDGDRIYELRR